MKEVVITGKTLVELSMSYADALVPESERPFDVRSWISPERDKGVNFTCFKILVAITFQKGFEFGASRPNASSAEIACAAIDYTLEHDLGCKQKRLDFFRSCFRDGVACQRRATVVECA